MVRCTNFPYIILLVMWRNASILGVDVTLSIDDTACVGNNITLKCAINSFTSATWSRNGSSVLTNCASSGFCTNDDVLIAGVTYYFIGTSTGTQVSFQIQPVEDRIKWICNDNGVPYDYTFDVLDKCPIVTPPEETSTTNLIGQTTSSQNPSTAFYHSEPTDTTIMTSTDDGLTSTSVRVTSEVTTQINTDNIVGTIIAIVIPVGIFLIIIAIIIFIIIIFGCSKRSKSTTTKKKEDEPTKPKKNRDKKIGDRKLKSPENRFYVGERNSSTIPQDFHRYNRIDNKGHTNSLYYPCRNMEPYSPHLYKQYSYQRRPDMVYGHDEPSRCMDYSFYQGDVIIQNGQFRHHYNH